MKLSKYQIEVLEEAKKLLVSGEQGWICDAIWFNWDKRNACIYTQTLACKRLTSRIQNLIKGCLDLEDWLHRKAGIEDSLLTPSNLRTYRVRWLDHMIATKEL